MRAAFKKDPRALEEAVRDIMVANPNASSNEILRRCHNAGIPAYRDIVQTIKLKMMREPRPPPAPVPAPVPEAEKNVADRWASEREAHMRLEPAEVNPNPEPEPSAPTPNVDTSPAARRRWTEDYILQNPTASYSTVQVAVKTKFGIGIDASLLPEIFRRGIREGESSRVGAHPAEGDAGEVRRRPALRRRAGSHQPGALRHAQARRSASGAAAGDGTAEA